MLKAYKTKLRPNRQQIRQFLIYGRATKQAFNWILAQYLDEYKIWYKDVQRAKDAGLWFSGTTAEDWQTVIARCAANGINIGAKPKPLARIRKKSMNAAKGNDHKLSLLDRCPSVFRSGAVDDVESAFGRYAEKKSSGEVSRLIAKRKDQPGQKQRYARMISRGAVGDMLDPCFPRFKRRTDPASFHTNDPRAFKVEATRVRLPNLGWVNLAEHDYIPLNPIRYIGVSISQDGDLWFVSVTVEEADHSPVLQPVTLGVSLGVNDLAATSAGTVIDNPRVLASFAAKRARLQRELARRAQNVATIKGKPVFTQNWHKTKAKLAKLERRIRRVRSWHQHNASREIVNTLPAEIALQDLAVSELMQEAPRRAARSYADAGIGELARQVAYKATWNGTKVRKVKKVRFCPACGSDGITVTGGLLRCQCGHSQRSSVAYAINLSRSEGKK